MIIFYSEFLKGELLGQRVWDVLDFKAFNTYLIYLFLIPYIQIWQKFYRLFLQNVVRIPPLLNTSTRTARFSHQDFWKVSLLLLLPPRVYSQLNSQRDFFQNLSQNTSFLCSKPGIIFQNGLEKAYFKASNTKFLCLFLLILSIGIKSSTDWSQANTSLTQNSSLLFKVK